MSDEKTEVCLEFAKAFNERDLERAKEFADPDYLFNARLAAVEGRFYHGHGGVEELLEDFGRAFKDYSLEIEDVIDAGANRLVMVYVFSFVSEAAGVPVTERGAHFWRIRNGRFWRGESYATVAEACEAAGIEPPGAEG